MGQQIDRFCEELRTTLTSIDSRFTSLQSKIDAKSQDAEREVRSQLDQARKRIDQNHAQVACAQARVKDWAETHIAPNGCNRLEFARSSGLCDRHDANDTHYCVSTSASRGTGPRGAGGAA